MKVLCMELNVFGEPLISCCASPLGGYFRDGYCVTDQTDLGIHTLCAIMDQDFLDFSDRHGNNLTAPRPDYNFPGLVPGDFWCISVFRWLEAFEKNVAPKVYLEATHEETLKHVNMEQLLTYAYRK